MRIEDDVAKLRLQVEILNADVESLKKSIRAIVDMQFDDLQSLPERFFTPDNATKEGNDEH